MRKLFLVIAILFIAGSIYCPLSPAEVKNITIYGRVAVDRGLAPYYGEPYHNPMPLPESNVLVFDRDPSGSITAILLAETITDIQGCYSVKISWDTERSGPLPPIFVVDARMGPPRNAFLSRKVLNLYSRISRYKVDFPSSTALLYVGGGDYVTIYGRVVDKSLTPVEGATVELLNLYSGRWNQVWRTVTRSDGSFRIIAEWGSIDRETSSTYTPPTYAGGNYIADIQLSVKKRTSSGILYGSETARLVYYFSGTESEYHYNTAEYMYLIKILAR